MVAWDDVVLVLWATFWLYWLLLGIKTRTEVSVKVRGQKRVGRYIQLALIAFAMYLIIGFHDTIKVFPTENRTLLLGVVILFLSLGFAVWARLILARNWSAAIQTVQNQKLIQTGPYKLIRHPIYTGVIGGFLGTLLIRGTLAAFVAFLIILIIYLLKIFYEEKFLIMHFGDQYVEYKKKTWVLIPFVY